MSDEIVIRYCAPTLAAIKTGSLFNCPFENRAELTDSLREVNRCVLQKGVCAVPLQCKNGKALIYLYRPDMLRHDLQNPLAIDILKKSGYPAGNIGKQLAWLVRRLRESETFPHEIGLFLGYPPVDVRGFIEHKPCKCTGLWKVFESDETESKKIFRRCENCTKSYLKRNQEGWSLSRLTIPHDTKNIRKEIK
jgi:hypothetical protein